MGGRTVKVTPEHLAEIRDAVTPLDTEEWRERYRQRAILRADQVKDIDKRYRWDLYYAAARDSEGGLPDSTNGYNMNHIDTALRAVVPPLGSDSD
jgi:hypothetical protein